MTLARPTSLTLPPSNQRCALRFHGFRTHICDVLELELPVVGNRMRTLIIGDLHHQTQTADAILASEPHQQAVFLGDFFDAFFDSPEQARQTATWVKARLGEPRNTLLFGNHDIPYAFDAGEFPFVSCSGFDRSKAAAVATVLGKEDWTLKAVARVGPWLVSHAGIHRDLLPHDIVRDWTALQARCDQALQALRRLEADPIFGAGRDRGGRNAIGGITWCDWKWFEGIEGIHQIVGHTPSKDEPLRHWSPPGSTNFCIDHCNGHTYAVVTARHTTFKQFRSAPLDPILLARVDHDALERARQTFAVP